MSTTTNPRIPTRLASTRRASSVEVLPQVIDFKQPRRSFTLHNSRAVPVTTMFIGNMMTVPPVHEVGAHTDTDADGEPIPGTYVVEDLFVDIPELGEEFQILDSARAVRHILGLKPGPDGVASTATSSFALAGMSLLPRHATKAQWHGVAESGEQRAFLAEVDRARYTVQNTDNANAIRKANGMANVSGGVEYERAAFLIEQFNALARKETAEIIAPHKAEALDDELEMDAYVHAQAQEIAGRVAEAKGVDKLKLVQALLDDPAVRVKLQKKYQIRKRGHKELDPEVLQAAADAGVESTVESGLEDK